MKNTTTKFQPIQAAMKIQRAWRAYFNNIHGNTCPYCYVYGCGGIYSEFNCPDMWENSDLIKLDSYLDRFNR